MNVILLVKNVRLVCLVLAMGTWSWNGAAQTPVINELMASNDLAHYDDFFEFDDWVEIYNPGGLVQLAGYHLSDDPNNLTKYTIPDTDPGTTFLTPGDHMIIWLDRDSVQGVLHANFKLSPEDEGVWLTDPDGETVLDFIQYPPQQTDISYGRACDGCEEWEYFNVPTPGATNAQTDLPTPTMYINEVLLENTAVLVDESGEFEPWLEVYNPNPFQVNLGGYTVLLEGGNNVTLPLDNPVETTVEADGFLLLWMDGEPAEGGHHLDLIPEVQNQTIRLIGPDMFIADEYDVQVSFANISWGRQTDGAATSVYFDTPTPRVTNSLVVVPAAPVVLNECLTFNVSGEVDNAGELEDWVELHNPTDGAIDLAGYYLTDRLNNPTKWRFPLDAGDSTVIAPNGYMLLWADNDPEQGWNHVEFRLNNAGEVLVLRSPDGFTIADSVHFGTSDPDLSYARIPNAVGPFEWVDEPTPGECNDCTEEVVEGESLTRPVFLGGNPSSPGAAIRLLEEAVLFDSSGKKVASLAKGWTQVPEGLHGVCVVQGASGHRQRLLVLNP